MFLSSLLWPVISALLVFMVLLPLGWLVLTSFQSDDTGALTLGNYRDAFNSAASLRAIGNTLALAFGVAVFATLIGTALAWLITRTNLPFTGFVRALVLASFVTPSFVGAIAWILLASPNAGWLNQAWVWMTGAQTPLVNVYTLSGAMFVMAIYALSYPFTLVTAALEQVPSEYENAARTLGAELSRITRSITLPLVLPAIISGFTLSFLEAIAAFGVPAFILIPARQPTMTVQLFTLFSESPPRLGAAAAYGMPLLIVTALLLAAQRRILHRRGYTLITGKGGTIRRAQLGAWRWPAFAAVMVVPLLSVVLPYGAMLLVSFSRAWGRGPFATGNLSLHWYRSTFAAGSAAPAALLHSLLYCAAAASISVVVATIIAYIRARRIISGSVVLGFLAMAPFVVPGLILGIGFYAAYAHPPFKLVGTPWIMIVAFATQFLPIAYANGFSMIRALNVDLENAGRILGASRMYVLHDITVPLLRAAVLSSWLLIFISAFRELSTAVFLFVGSTAVITTTIFDYSSAGEYGSLCVLSIVMMLVMFAASFLIYQVFGIRTNRLQSTELLG